VVRASYVSQDTAPALLGLCARKYLEVVVPKCAGDVVRVGRTVLVPLEVAESALRALAISGSDPAADDDGQPTCVDAVLKSVGMRRRVGQ
jgi:hypothetical protein